MSFRAASPVRMLVATLVPSEICYGRTRLLASTGPCAHPTMPHARWPDSELISKPGRPRSCSSAATGPAVGWDSHPRRSAGAELRREHAARLRVCRRHRCICCSTAVSRANLVRRWWRRSARGTGRSGIVRARCVRHAPPTPLRSAPCVDGRSASCGVLGRCLTCRWGVLRLRWPFLVLTPAGTRPQPCSQLSAQFWHSSLHDACSGVHEELRSHSDSAAASADEWHLAHSAALLQTSSTAVRPHRPGLAIECR